MEPNAGMERGSGNHASASRERVELAWAELAGLVRVNPDGSWTATELARSWLDRDEARKTTDGDAGRVVRGPF